MQTDKTPIAKGKTTLNDAIEKAKAKGQAVKPEAQAAANAVKPAEVKKTEPVMPETPKDVRTVIDQPQQLSADVVQPAEIKNGQLILTQKHLELIKTQIAKDATKPELDLFLMMAYRTRLDPLMKQLYFIKYRNKRASESNGCRCGWSECTCGKSIFDVSYVTSIDGYRTVAHRTNEFAGVDEPLYSYNKNDKLTHCAITVYKIVGNVRCPFTAKVKFAEYNTSKNLWSKMPETMIAKVAEAHALRKAFPQDLSGIYTTDEMDQAKRETKPVRKIEKPRIEMVTKNQAKMITQVIQQNELDIEEVKEFVEENYNCTSVSQLTKKQAGRLITDLETMSPVVEDTSFESFVDAEYEGDDIADDAFNALG